MMTGKGTCRKRSPEHEKPFRLQEKKHEQHPRKTKMQRRREKCFSLIHPFVANRQRHPSNLEEKKSWEVEIKGRRKVSGVSRFEGEKRKTAELLRREAKKTWISHFLRREKEGKQTSLFENSITIGGGGGMGSTGGERGDESP